MKQERPAKPIAPRALLIALVLAVLVFLRFGSC